jgi:peptidoglycan hydrolase CwlO-like protein
VTKLQLLPPSGPASKGLEEQKQEKDSLEREVNDLKAKLTQTVTAYDELERKNMATGAKVDTMAQHLEVSFKFIKEKNPKFGSEPDIFTFALT